MASQTWGLSPRPSLDGLLLLLVLILIAAKLAALFAFPMISDEPDDLNILLMDSRAALDFFDKGGTYAFDQSRLPHYLGAPVALIFGANPIQPLRLFFFLFHLAALWVLFRLVMQATGERTLALLFLALTATSAYLSGFSFLAFTAGDTLYIWLHHLTLYHYFFRLRQGGSVYVFALLLALTIASKLFGVFLILALIGYELLTRETRGRTFRSPVGWRKLLGLNLATTGLILAINLMHWAPATQLYAAMAIALGYLVVFLALALLARANGAAIHHLPFLAFWAVSVSAAFNLVLALSPIYLNLDNIFWMLDWGKNWNTGLIVQNAHWYDMIVVMGVKYGPLPGLLLIAVGLAFLLSQSPALRRYLAGDRGRFVLMITLVFVLHLVMISVVKHKTTWFPLAIFGFLYLPIVLGYGAASAAKLKSWSWAFMLVAAITIADNLYRYAYWFPYAHWDGAQYGQEHIGWNRSGLISTEAFPQVYAFLTGYARDRPRVRVNVQVIGVKVYNSLVRKLLTYHFKTRGHTNVSFRTLPPGRRDPSELMITSPLYHADFEAGLDPGRYRLIKTIELKGLELARIWSRP